MRRIESLDYLRGLMALSVALYHFIGMCYHRPPAEDLLGKLGIYAVSIFYVLSGLSLTLAYKDQLGSAPLIAAYAVKRVFRIAPLYWLVVTLSVPFGFAIASVTNTTYSVDYWRLFLNYSLLFGFVKPDAYLSIGAWSIGNEMVFYTLFPFLIYLGLKGRAALTATGLGFFLVYAVFAFILLDPAKPLDKQFVTYINPFNQAFLFVAGVMAGFLLDPRRAWQNRRWALPSLAAAFVFFPVSGDQISISAGLERIALSFVCIGFVAVLYVSRARLENVFGKALALLGEMSYSVYLLHPFVGGSIVLMARKLGVQPGLPLLTLLLLVGLPATLLSSYASFRFLERPMMRVGARLAARISAAAPVSSQSAAGRI